MGIKVINTTGCKMREKGFISASEAAKAVGKSIYTIYRWETEGRIKGMTVAEHRFVSVDSLVGYLGIEAASMLGLVNEAPTGVTNEMDDTEHINKS